jgi:hypothetical protein
MLQFLFSKHGIGKKEALLFADVRICSSPTVYIKSHTQRRRSIEKEGRQPFSMYQLMEFGAIFSNKKSDLLKSFSKLQTHSRVSC